MSRQDERDYLRDRMLTEEVMAMRASNHEAQVAHAELARMYRVQLRGRR